MDIDCKSLLIIYKDSADPNAATAKVYADGELRLTIDPKIIGWTHANPFIVFEETETKRHHIEVKMKDGFENGEFTICGFGVVE
ncbi:MAG: SGNH/GDSL hydrolase family protein, partial [Lachnospiraceae bacterium]|nr:SGNH/GDSL hydrolase family protein [Lachnospiraceae bacterium]